MGFPWVVYVKKDTIVLKIKLYHAFLAISSTILRDISSSQMVFFYTI